MKLATIIVHWIGVFLIRILVTLLGVIRIPFLLMFTFGEYMNEFLEQLQLDLRSSWQWRWLKEYEKRWEIAKYHEKERLIENLRDFK